MTHHLTPLQRLAVEAIQEDERLIAGLDDAQAEVLLRWATARAAELTCDAVDEVAAEAVAQAIRNAVRAAVRADGAVATAERALAQALPTGVASSLPTSRTLGGAEPAAVSFGLSRDTPKALPPPPRSPRLLRRWPESLPLSLLAHLGRR